MSTIEFPRPSALWPRLAKGLRVFAEIAGAAAIALVIVAGTLALRAELVLGHLHVG